MEIQSFVKNGTRVAKTIFLRNCKDVFSQVKEVELRMDEYSNLWVVGPLSLKTTGSIWNRDSPFNHSIPNFLAQASISILGTSAMKSILEPFGVNSFIAQMLVSKKSSIPTPILAFFWVKTTIPGGLLLGPSGLGGLSINKMFNWSTLYILDTVQYFGCMFFLFLVGVKTDISMVKKSGKMALVVGFLSFFLPVLLATLVSFIVKANFTLPDAEIRESITYIAGLLSLSSPHAIVSFLADLNLLSSELGRIAMSASMISGVWSLFAVFITLTLLPPHDENKNVMGTLFSCLGIILIIVCLVRPILVWVQKRTDKVKEEYMIAIFLAVLISSCTGELLGQHYLVGPLLLGLVVPPGPPLGTAIEDNLDCFVTFILVPIIVISRVGPVMLYGLEHLGVVMLLAFFSFLGKLFGAIIPAIFSNMPYQDALILGLIMNVQGVLDIQIWVRALSLKILTQELYGCLVCSMMIMSGSISVIVKFLYDPSRKYVAFKRKTIQNSKPNEDLPILACIYHEDHVPSIISLLEASNPTTYSPTIVYALELIQLQGRATPLLITHKPKSITDPSENNPTTRIIKSFTSYANHNRGIVSINSYTAISPYNTMHDDICSLGLDKKTSLIIIPFHHQPAILPRFKAATAIQKVNLNVLDKAPCSVGILISKSYGTNCYNPPSNVVVIFLGGPDDREALAYGARIGDNAGVKLTVIRFMDSDDRKQQGSKEKRIDDDVITAFRYQTANSKNVDYIAEVVTDGVELIMSIKRVESMFDLLIVGRQHGEEATELLRAFDEWNDFPELGVIGDMLVSSDSKTSGSILVMQQQPKKKTRRQQIYSKVFSNKL